MAHTMKLYTFFRSSSAFRVRIALNLKNMSYQSIPLQFKNQDHKSKEFLAKNPQGLLPTFEDGPAVISQSLAILEYLEAVQPTPHYLPVGELAKAKVRELSYAIACEIHPLNNLRVLKYLAAELDHDQEQINSWYQHWVKEGFEAVEKMVQPSSGDTPCCFGSQVTMADICLIPQIWNANRFKCDLSPYPKLLKINVYVSQLPAFQKAAPENQSDAV